MEIYIYKIQNKINNKIYIGQTINYDKRIDEHIYGRKNTKQHKEQVIDRAIKKYGKNNFSFEKIYTCSSQQEADEKEKKYIKIFNSLKPNGYNILEGGRYQQGSWNSKEIFEYDLDGNFIKKYKSANEVERLSNKKYLSSCVLDCCKNKNKRCKDRIFTFKSNKLKIEPYIKPKSSRCKKIYQYDIYGNYINEYESVTLASEICQIRRTLISQCLNKDNYTAGNYQWRYEKKDKIEPCEKIINNYKGNIIYQLDDYGNILESYLSTTQAVKSLGLERLKYKQLWKCIKNQKKFMGFYWKMCKDNIVPSLSNDRKV